MIMIMMVMMMMIIIVCYYYVENYKALVHKCSQKTYSQVFED